MGYLVWTRLAVVAVLIMVASGNDDGDHVMEGGTLRDSWANAVRVKIMGRLGESSPITPSTQRVIDQVVAVVAAEMPSMPSRSDAALDLGASACHAPALQHRRRRLTAQAPECRVGYETATGTAEAPGPCHTRAVAGKVAR